MKILVKLLYGIFASCALIVSVFVISHYFLTSIPPTKPEKYLVVKPQQSGILPKSTGIQDFSKPFAFMELTVVGLDPMGLKIDAIAKFKINTNFLRNILDWSKINNVHFEEVDEDWRVFSEDQHKMLHIKEPYKDSYFEFDYTSDNFIEKFRVPLKAFESKLGIRGYENVAVINLEKISLPGQSSQYQNDWYWLKAFVSLTIPAPLALYQEKANLYYQLGFNISVYLVGKMEGFKGLLERKDTGREINLTIKRATNIILFLYTILGSFFVLAIILIIITFASEKTRRESIWTIITGIAVLTIALLPLRAVLIPSDISGLTRTDTILGVIIALLNAVIAAKIIVTNDL